MTNYVKSTDFAAKDALVSGNPAKLIKGTEINDEFNNIQTAIATKADLASPAFSGNPTCATQAIGNNSTRVANTAFVQQEIADAETAINITGGNISAVNITDVIITDADISGLVSPIAVADGGTGTTSFTANSVILGNGTSSLNGNIVSPETTGNVLTANGTTWESKPKLTLGTAINSTSGTSIDFTGIPSWAKRITVVLNGVSKNSTSPLLIQIGDSGGIETSGYISSGGTTSGSAAILTSTFGFIIYTPLASETVSALLTLVNITGNSWVESHSGKSSTANVVYGGGDKTLSDTISQLRVIASSTGLPVDTFDAGTINIVYE